MTTSPPGPPSTGASAPARRPAAGVGQPDYLLVGGVPGAGKSTAIAAAVPDLVDVRVLDPDTVRAWLKAHLPAGLPYTWYRPLVHLVHLSLHVWWLLRGPASARLLVHDPSTRSARLVVMHRLAVWRGWTPLLLYVDTEPAVARAGQFARARVVHGGRFAAHCRRWSRLRQGAVTGTCHGWPTQLCSRVDAADTLRRALAGRLRAAPRPVADTGRAARQRSASVRCEP